MDDTFTVEVALGGEGRGGGGEGEGREGEGRGNELYMVY